MYLLKLPEYKIEDFYKEMLNGRHNNVKNKFLNTRLLTIQPLLQEAQDNYKKLGEEQSLHTIQENTTINIPSDVELDQSIPRTVDVKEMEKVYSNFLVDKPDSNKIGRRVYDSILSNTYYNLCPYCSQREVKTVDHYLPKTQFSSFAITPYNLLPCCSDCNKDKLDSYILQEEKMIIHPYFDDISRQSWLRCTVVENTWPITFSFFVSDTVFDATLRSRIKYHFQLFNLSKLYADNATREFNSRVKLLVKEYNSNPEGKALDYINDNLESYKEVKLNSWQTKMFEALKSSNWFIETALPQLQAYYKK
ncbi:hypothetical protein ICA_03054 [Bacillus cereus BAG1O-3]|uniref:hypothetical protein n=1 Tax=Bacillus TaxID=1386 RepID=UPI0003537C3D|nr:MULTISPECIES: hypothetical protein [Bacillus]EPF10543.1 hypothetical protein ICA_03054 [Bacillus cereus BAG1O-3]MDR4411572.1 hypothetical protein [Bacillus thuringiensis]PFG81511.1 hypothetical protein DL97_1107 [Bacillus sp. YF23]